MTVIHGHEERARLDRDAAAAYEVVKAGGVAVIPTDVSYGMIATTERGVRRIYELKGRPLSKACITVSTPAIFSDVALPLDGPLHRWVDDIRARTPIAVVTRLNPTSRLLAPLTDYTRTQATQDATIATFFNAGDVVVRVAELAFTDGALVIGSSANISGTGNNCSFAEIPASIVEGADLAIDYGHVRYANTERLSTTILDLTTGEFVRKGVNYALIQASWDEHRRAARV